MLEIAIQLQPYPQPLDDLILHVAGKFGKQGAVAADAHHQIRMGAFMISFLGQQLLVDHIALKHREFEFQAGENIGGDCLAEIAVVGGNVGKGEVKHSHIGEGRLGEGSHGGCGRGQHRKGGHVHLTGQGLTCAAAIGGCSGDFSVGLESVVSK